MGQLRSVRLDNPIGLNFVCDFFWITKMDTVGQADIIGTGRIEALLHPVIAEIAFDGNIPLLVKPDCIVRTRLQTGSAAGARVSINQDDTGVRVF